MRSVQGNHLPCNISAVCELPDNPTNLRRMDSFRILLSHGAGFSLMTLYTTGYIVSPDSASWVVLLLQIPSCDYRCCESTSALPISCLCRGVSASPIAPSAFLHSLHDTRLQPSYLSSALIPVNLFPRLRRVGGRTRCNFYHVHLPFPLQRFFKFSRDRAPTPPSAHFRVGANLEPLSVTLHGGVRF